MAFITATFSLYELQEGGSPLWSESRKVQLDAQGRYVVLLGATSPSGLPLPGTSNRLLITDHQQPTTNNRFQRPHRRAPAPPLPATQGTATANTVGKFASACDIESSLIRDNGTGVAAGGTNTPAGLLDVQYTSTATSGSLLGQSVYTTVNPGAYRCGSSSLPRFLSPLRD